MLELKLRERGAPVAVSPDQWRQLQMEQTVGALSRTGILRIERSPAAILLFPSHFVGEFLAQGLRLTIQAKDEPLFAAVLKLAAEFCGKQTHHQMEEQSTESGADLATPFVKALGECVDEGLPWQYDRLVEATCQPKGRPYFGKTISDFVSRGVMHKVVAARQERSQAEQFSTVVWTAYLCLRDAPGATDPLVARAALLAEALEHTGELSVPLAIDTGAKILQAGALLSKSARSLVKAALALIERAEASGTALLLTPSGIARFANMERLWEQAVANLVSTLVRRTNAVALHGLSGAGVRLFGPGGPSIDPDVVALGDDGSVNLVADAKYKVLGERDAQGFASDVYQLTCYVERTRASNGLLIYTGPSDGVVELGRSESGCRILVVRISASSLTSDGHHALAHLLETAGFAVERFA